MGLPWVRLDTQFPHNPKVLALAEDKKWRAIAVYLCSLSYSGAHGTDGFIPPGALNFIHATKADARQLVAVGLWHEDGPGWQIPDWSQYQPTSKENEERRERARKAAWKRWHPEDSE